MKKIIYFLISVILALNSLVLIGCNEVPEGVQIPTYNITATAEEGGALVASKASAKQGESVSFTVTANSGYFIEKLTVNGGEVTVSKDGNYTMPAVLSAVEAKAYFIKSNVTVKFSAESAVVPDKPAIYGETYGELPTPFVVGKRFIGWTDENGNEITATSVCRGDEVITLTAKFETLTASDIAALKPHTATTAYYDKAATKYGVNWHVNVKPVFPVIYVTDVFNGDEPDFAAAREIECQFDIWDCGQIPNPYYVTGIVDELEFNTRYAVKFGDKAANAWSKTYDFVTRAEQLDAVSFTYVTDTQETYLINGQSGDNYIGDTYWSQTMLDATQRFPDTDFVANGGDITNYGNFPIYWQEMFDSVDEYLFNLPIMAVAGNHAEAGWYSAGYWSFSRMFNIDAPQDNNIVGLYYSFDFGPVHFISLRSNDVLWSGYGGKYSDTQMAWFEADLQAVDREKTPWVIVMHHEGVISPAFKQAGPNYHEHNTLPQLFPLFDQYDVNLVLFGHNHNHASTYPMVWEEGYAGYTNGLGVERRNIKMLTNTTHKEEYDGVEVDVFDLPAGTTDIGTVLHQTATAGNQFNKTYKWNELEQNRVTYGEYYRVLGSNAAGYYDDYNRTFYTHFNVDEQTLVARTYGMAVQEKVKNEGLESLNTNPYTKYIEGFKLVQPTQA